LTGLRLVLVTLATLVLTGCGSQGGDLGSGDFENIPGIGATRVDVPRPTGPATAACDDDPLPPETEERVAERVAALRAVGLFADQATISDADLATEVEAGLADTFGAAEDVPPDILDLAVAEQDRARVWWRDLEADVVDGNDVYVQTLDEWGDISAEAFAPTDIVVSWAGSDGPVTVEFAQGGATHDVSPAYLEDWIDPGILVPINELIADSGRRFELYKAFDQTAFVMALTDAERRGFEARGWCFE
jgi:hypothetical protein